MNCFFNNFVFNGSKHIVNTLILALTIASTGAFVPETTLYPRVDPLNIAPMKISPIRVSPHATKPEYLSNTSPTSPPMGLSYQDSKKSVLTNTDEATLVQGGSLRTWSYRSPLVEQVQVVLSSDGRPLDADVELWHGPDNAPYKMRVYVENGQLRSFNCVIATPRGPNTVAIRNIGQIEFPIKADVYSKNVNSPSFNCVNSAKTIQGGALRTYPFDPLVTSVEVLLKTDGRPLNARIELLQGPNNNKQVIELYTEDGLDRPFFAILGTPGSGNVVRIVNTAPVEFPMSASVAPHSIDRDMASGVGGGDVIIGGDIGWW